MQRITFAAKRYWLHLAAILASTMYQTIKQIARSLIPQAWLSRYEDQLRSLIAWRYRGQEYRCNCCDFHLARFVELDNGEKLCPRCGSLPRTRRLWQLLQDEFGLENKALLHFSPPKSLAQQLAKSPLATYHRSDYEGEFAAELQLDLTKIDLPDHSYDFILCYHVLEHIEADQLAMRELFRILRPGGHCLIQTPFKTGEIYEDLRIQSPEERLIHFGQADHVRIYSVPGLMERLQLVGFELERRDFTSHANDQLGLKQEETILLAKKST